MLFFGSALAQCSLKSSKFSTPHFELHQSAWVNWSVTSNCFFWQAEDNSICGFLYISFLDTTTNFNNFMTPDTVALDFLSEVNHGCYLYYHLVEFWATTRAFHCPELSSYFTLSSEIFFMFICGRRKKVECNVFGDLLM